MKVLIQVNSKSQIPDQYLDRLLVVDISNPYEALLFLKGKSTDQAVFFPAGTPIDLFLKVIDEYQGNLAVYSAMDVGEVMRSRFTKVINRESVSVDTGFGASTQLDKQVTRLKELLP